MILIILRILLFLLPIVALIIWLRWRMKEDKDEAALDNDVRRMRTVLIVIALAILATGLALKFMDGDKGEARTKYIPPHTVNGEVVPGRFVAEDEAEEIEKAAQEKN